MGKKTSKTKRPAKLQMESADESSKVEVRYAPDNHEHEPPPTHDHPHTHEPTAFGHDHPHEHSPQAHEHPHDHREQLGQLRGTVRALLAVIEAGSVNSEQRKALHAVRVVIGDAYGSSCLHENTVYEQGDRLMCQDCRAHVTPDAGG